MCMNSDDNNFICHPLRRLAAGTLRRTADKLILSPSQCKLQPPGLKSIDVNQQVNVINLQLNDVQMKASVNDLMLPQPRRKFIETRTRATQTLFRESSAQTLSYLPGLPNNSTELEELEIFRLPAILNGNRPPGLYEVEVLQRARRRWAFAKALKENFRKQLEIARHQAKLQDHEHILEAFEWEHWIEREEYIQECQMLRLELLIRMFDEREREMHKASKTRIQKSYEEIEAKRNIALKKNKIEYKRAIRRIEMKHAKQPRVWRKEHITQALGDPQSEFYAPKMRYGVNPSRRHYTASSPGFDVRMESLKNKVKDINSKDIRCPLAKLTQWSTPKKNMLEVEQNFCSDENLNNLYENLRTLREKSSKQKYTPLCLKAKITNKEPIIKEKEVEPTRKDTTEIANAAEQLHITGDSTDKLKPYKPLIHFDTVDLSENSSLESIKLSESFEQLRQQKQAERYNMEVIHNEMRCEELDALISSYEGNTIGWLMRFLSEELSRLKEQRKLQFFTMMAKRERWRREAAEAGLRQKENSNRDDYENLYDECDQINIGVAKKFLNSVLDTDIEDIARQKVEQDVVSVAKDIDKEISAWLESFTEVQSPSKYHILRHALKNIVVPDVEKILYHLERHDCIDNITNNVLLGKVYHGLEPYDVSLNIATNFVDRLLDNDLYLHSTDSSSDSEPYRSAPSEAKAIIRKLIRYAVPGRRWLTDKERIVAENIRDLLDDVFHKAITQEDSFIDVYLSHSPHVGTHGAHTDLISIKKVPLDIEDHLDSSLELYDKPKLNFFCAGHETTITDITKSLQWNETLLLYDPDILSNDALLMDTNKYIPPEPKARLSNVRVIPSTHNLSLISDFGATPIYTQTSSEEHLDLMHTEAEEIKEEISLFNEGFTKQLQSEEENNNDEEEKQTYFEVEETQQFQETISETTEVSIIAVDSEYYEDNTSSLMQASFSYNSEVMFSVAIPTNNEIAIEDVDVIKNIENSSSNINN